MAKLAKIILSVLIVAMMASSVFGAIINTGFTYTPTGGTTLVASLPVVFDGRQYDFNFQDAGAGNTNIRLVTSTAYPYLSQFSSLTFADLLYHDSPTAATFTNIASPAQVAATVGFTTTQIVGAVVARTAASQARVAFINLAASPATQIAQSTVGGVPIQVSNPRIIFNQNTGTFYVIAANLATNGLFVAEFSMAGVQITGFQPINFAGFPVTSFDVPRMILPTMANEFGIIATSSIASSTVFATILGNTAIAGPTVLTASQADDVTIDEYGDSLTQTVVSYIPRFSTNVNVALVNPTTATVTNSVTVAYNTPQEVEVGYDPGGNKQSDGDTTLVVNDLGTTKITNINIGLGSTIATNNAPVNINFGAGTTVIGGISGGTSFNGGGRGSGTGAGGGTTLSGIGIGSVFIKGPSGGNIGGGAGGQGGGGGGDGGADGGPGAHDGFGCCAQPGDFMPTGYGNSFLTPWESTQLYFAPCSTLTTAVRNFLDNLYRGSTTGSDLVYQNSAPFTAAARLSASTPIAQVKYRECMSGSPQDLSKAENFPQQQGAGFIGVFSTPDFSGQKVLIPISYGVRADKPECTDAIDFYDATPTLRHTAYVDTVEGVTVRVLTNPPGAVRVRLLDSTAAVVYDSNSDTPPSTETDVTTMVFTGFATAENIAAQATPIHGASYDFASWNFVDSLASFRVDTPDNSVKTTSLWSSDDAICGMRLVRSKPANQFLHTVSRTPGSAGVAIPYGTTANEIQTVADFASQDPFGVFAEQSLLTPDRRFTNGFDLGTGSTSATPEFSPTTLLLAVLLGGALVVFVVRRRQA